MEKCLQKTVKFEILPYFLIQICVRLRKKLRVKKGIKITKNVKILKFIGNWDGLRAKNCFYRQCWTKYFAKKKPKNLAKLDKTGKF